MTLIQRVVSKPGSEIWVPDAEVSALLRTLQPPRPRAVTVVGRTATVEIDSPFLGAAVAGATVATSADTRSGAKARRTTGSASDVLLRTVSPLAPPTRPI
jgi:hypothetical protein